MAPHSRISIVLHLAVAFISCTVQGCQRSSLTFDDIKRPSDEFSFESVEVNGVRYDSDQKAIPLPKGKDLKITAKFQKKEKGGMVRAGTVKVIRPDGDAILVLQSGSFKEASGNGSTLSITASLNKIPEEAEAGSALLRFSSGSRTYVEVPAVVAN